MGIFYSVLRDTLVCDNIEIATEIAFKGKYRKRVATIDGKLIEITGLMSGGGLAKNLKSRMSSKFKNELSKE